MRLFQTISMAFRAIAANKIRAFLTMLGVIIGVMSVIVLVSIGQGTTASITESISSMGTNLLTVTIQTRRIGMNNRNFRSNASSRGTVILKLPEILALEEHESIACVSPVCGLVHIKVAHLHAHQLGEDILAHFLHDTT